MHPEISRFIGSHIVATVCCSADNEPYCFNCYYSFIQQEGLLIFKSSLGTRHERILAQNRSVAGTIIPKEVEVAVIKGIQFQGIVLPDSIDLTFKASASYYLAFPFAATIPGKLYLISLMEVKYTDNTKGFGYKNEWMRAS